MDGSRFDRLAQAVGGNSRRHALRAALGGVVATTGFAASRAEGDAKKKKKCKKKKCPQCLALELGEACTSNLDCCANETNLICAERNGGGGPVCCGGLGSACENDNACCFGFGCALGSGTCLIALT